MKKVLYLFLALAAFGFYACDDNKDIKLPDIKVAFSATEMGIDNDTKSADVMLTLSRAANTDVAITVLTEVSDLVYTTDYTTTPATAANKIDVTIPKGQTSATIKVSMVNGVLYEGTETIKFTISQVSNPIVIDEKKELTLTFDAIISTGNQLTLEGKTAESNYTNSVYVDLSTNTQLSTNRNSWTLGFYGGAEFRVFLNPARQMAAAATTKTDINAVTVADASGLVLVAFMGNPPVMIPLTNVDDLAGDLTKTAYTEVSATAADNKVHIVAYEGNNASPADYYKVKVTRTSTGYSVQYGKLGGTEIKTVEVNKDVNYNMACLSFENQTISKPEPKAKNWDIEWTYGTGPTGADAYWMQDYVYLNNLGGAKVAQVLTTKVTYGDFKVANLEGLNFTSNRSAIGSSWRVTANMSGATEPLGVRSDRFYIVKDPAGNYYKLKFTKIGVSGANDGGIRGLPQIEYTLVKVAE